MVFKIGDVVELKSGGPSMTITVVRENDEVMCEWFDGSTRESGVFKTATVQYPQPPLMPQVEYDPYGRS